MEIKGERDPERERVCVRKRERQLDSERQERQTDTDRERESVCERGAQSTHKSRVEVCIIGWGK